MVADFKLRWDATEEQLIGEDPNGNEIAIPLNALDVSGSASIDGTVEPFEAGHDEVRVPQVRELTVEDWESGTLDTDVWDPFDNSLVSVQSSVVDSGEYALEILTQSDGKFSNIRSDGGLLSYPQKGDVFRTFVRGTDPSQRITVRFLTEKNNVNLIVDYNSDQIITADDVGNVNTNDVGLSSYINEWLEVVAEIGTDGSISLTLFDSGGDTIGSLPTQVTSDITDIRFVNTDRADTSQLTGYIGKTVIKRREPQARANTAKGVTERGNEVGPSGAIQTGPMEVPTDHPTYPLVNLPVTDDLSAGEQVGYHLAINQDKALTVEAEADGNGGIQNTQVSFENTQIADPAHNTSADSMTADPESASEDGYVEVDIDGTTYQVPMYQA